MEMPKLGLLDSNVSAYIESNCRPMSRLLVWRLGRVPYARALALQERLVSQRRSGDIGDTLLSLQHPPTFTLGKRKTAHNLLTPPEELVSRLDAEVQYTDRGGDVTFHGPGQAVLYPILSLRPLGLGARRYVEGLEDVMVNVARMHGLNASGKIPLQSGCWIEEERKIGAVGVQISGGGITSHGLAFNIDPDLSFFEHIVPCGIHDKEVTSLAKEIGSSTLDNELVTEQLIDSFAEVFGFIKVVKEIDREALEAG